MRGISLAVFMLLTGMAAGAGIVWFGIGPLSPSSSSAPADKATASDVAPNAAQASSLDAAGEVVVSLDVETQKRIGLSTTVLEGATHRPYVLAYGVLQEDPSQSFSLHAPAAGTVRAADSGKWPDIHAAVEKGTLVGVVEPRLTLTEQIDLSARLTQARADASEAEAALASAQSSYEHKKALNIQNKAVSDRAVEEARAAVQSQEAHLEAARRIVALMEAAQNPSDRADQTFELRIPLAGEVVDIPMRPGESVEPGQLLLRVASFNPLIARVELPVGVVFDPSATSAIVELIGTEKKVPGRRVGLGASLDLAAHGTALLYRISNAEGAFRPGAPVVARVPAPGHEQEGVLIPRAAVVRLFGRMWVYVADADGTFIRRLLNDGEWLDDSCFIKEGFSPGERVVTAGAQVLLSRELKTQIEREEAASE